jgi:hypothetical protein
MLRVQVHTLTSVSVSTTSTNPKIIEWEKLEIGIEFIDESSVKKSGDFIIFKSFDYLAIDYWRIHDISEEEGKAVRGIFYEEEKGNLDNPIIVNVKDIYHYKGQLPLLGFIDLEKTAVTKLNLEVKDSHLNEGNMSLIDSIPSRIEVENKGIKEDSM